MSELNETVEGQDGLKYHFRSNKLYVPPPLREAMLYWFHASMYGGHLGIGRTQRRVGKFVWWPGLSKDVQSYVGSCWLCAGNRTPSKPRSVRGLLEKPCPMQLVSLDYVGSFQWPRNLFHEEVERM